MRVIHIANFYCLKYNNPVVDIPFILRLGKLATCKNLHRHWRRRFLYYWPFILPPPLHPASEFLLHGGAVAGVTLS